MAFHSKMSAQTKRIGRLRTALPTASGAPLYLTISDPSNPDPSGGVILATSDSTCSTNSKQSFILVGAPRGSGRKGELRGQLKGEIKGVGGGTGGPCYMIVTENMDYKLRMSDRRGFYKNRGYILEAVPTSRKEIEGGCTPAQDFVFRVERLPSTGEGQVASQGSSCPLYRFVALKDGCEVAIDSYVPSGEQAVEGTHVLGYEAGCEKLWQQWMFQYEI